MDGGWEVVIFPISGPKIIDPLVWSSWVSPRHFFLNDGVEGFPREAEFNTLIKEMGCDLPAIRTGVFSPDCTEAFGPATQNESTWGPKATGAEITSHFSGYTFTTPSNDYYFGGDGRFRVYARRDNNTFSEGKWRVDSSSGVDLLLLTEQSKHQAIEGTHVVSEEEKVLYRVYIKPSGNDAAWGPDVALASNGRMMSLNSPIQGFSREAEFNSVRMRVMAGEEVKQSTGAMIREGATIILLCVPLRGILCPL